MEPYYIYCLIDPSTNLIFYIGKGKNKRMFSHVRDVKRNKIPNGSNYHLFYKIKNILDIGQEVISKKLYVNLNEEEAFTKEIEEIKNIGLENLCNISKGGRGGSVWNEDKDRNRKISQKISLASKGRKLDEQWKQNITRGLLNRNYHHTEEYKQKMSSKMSGENNPMYGKKVSEETRLKISQSSKNRPCSLETRKKISNLNMGRIRSQETKEKISKSKKGKSLSIETRQKMSQSHKGKKLPREQVEKIANANRGRKRSEETKKKLSIAASKKIGHKNARWVSVPLEDIELIKKTYKEKGNLYNCVKTLKNLGKPYGRRVVQRILDQ